MKLRSHRRHVRLVLLAVCAAVWLGWVCAARGEGGEPRYFAIKNARIVPVSGPVIANGTVVIAKGLSQSVGTNVTIPPEAWVIDGTGLTVYPGLIDAGTNIGLAQDDAAAKKPGAGSAASGPEDRPATTPWRVAADELKTDDKRIESWRNAGFTTALTVPEGGIFPGQGTVIDLGGERAGDYVVNPRASVPVSFKPVGGFFGFPDSLMGTIAYVRQVLDDTAWYAQAEPAYESNPAKYERPSYDRTEGVMSEAEKRSDVVVFPDNTPQ